MHQLLNPRSIALVGASEESPWSQGFMRNLRSFPGEIHLVNPRRDHAFGRKVLPSLTDIGQPVDHVAVLVAASRVADVLRDAAAADIRSATVIASGFGEGDGTGAEYAEQVAQLSAEHGIAVIGPNCYGFNNYAGTYISRFNIDVPSLPGTIGLSFQSGQLGGATADAASARGIHLRYVVSSGNELVVDTNDYLEYFLSSDDINVIGGVFERIPDPERFERIALAAIDAGKPIVALKPGRSAAASRIAVAHTGAITGADAITDAYLADLGVIRVSSVEELAETAGLLATRGWPKGPRTVFFGFSGGASELFADEADGTSIVLEPHSPQVRTQLSEVSTLPEGVIHNPFDMTVDGAVHYAKIVEVLAASGDYDVLISQGQPRRSFEAPLDPGDVDWVEQFLEFNGRALFGAAEQNDVFATFLDTSDHQPGIGVYDRVRPHNAHWVFGMNGVKSISNAIDYGVSRARIRSRKPVDPIPVDAAALPDVNDRAGALTETDSKQLLKAYGVPVTEDVLATSAEAAVAAADRLGYPVVLKVVAGNVAHKSDAGGVELGLQDAGGVAVAYERIVAAVAANVPGAQIEGVIVARHAAGGAEFIAGITSDPALGPVVVVGLGGIYVEVLKDTVLLRPPFHADEAVAALQRLKSWPILAGTRGSGALDVGALAEALTRIGQLALDQRGRLVELDVNPLFVFPEGQGVLAADALAVFATHEGANA